MAAVATCIVYFGGRALGLGGDAPASGGDPPVLTISVPEFCETGREDPGYGSVWGYDDEDNWVRMGTSGPFYSLSDIDTVELAWSISGGTEPYEISVQGQTLLTGPTGSTLVYCAESLPYDELDFTQRRSEYESTRLDGRPVVNPGPMTFEATVEDADGLTVTATTRTYVIIDCSRYCGYDIIPSGYTYRIFGRLMTIPRGLDIYLARYGVNTVECIPGAKWCSSCYDLDLIGDGGGALYMSTKGNYLGYYWKGIRYYPDAPLRQMLPKLAGRRQKCTLSRMSWISSVLQSIAHPNGCCDAGDNDALGLTEGEEGGHCCITNTDTDRDLTLSWNITGGRVNPSTIW